MGNITRQLHTFIPTVVLSPFSEVHLPRTCQPESATVLSLSPLLETGVCLWDLGPITSKLGALISILGPVKATQGCTMLSTLNRLAAGLFNIRGF